MSSDNSAHRWPSTAQHDGNDTSPIAQHQSSLEYGASYSDACQRSVHIFLTLCGQEFDRHTLNAGSAIPQSSLTPIVHNLLVRMTGQAPQWAVALKYLEKHLLSLSQSLPETLEFSELITVLVSSSWTDLLPVKIVKLLRQAAQHRFGPTKQKFGRVPEKNCSQDPSYVHTDAAVLEKCGHLLVRTEPFRRGMLLPDPQQLDHQSKQAAAQQATRIGQLRCAEKCILNESAKWLLGEPNHDSTCSITWLLDQANKHQAQGRLIHAGRYYIRACMALQGSAASSIHGVQVLAQYAQNLWSQAQEQQAKLAFSLARAVVNRRLDVQQAMFMMLGSEPAPTQKKKSQYVVLHEGDAIVLQQMSPQEIENKRTQHGWKPCIHEWEPGCTRIIEPRAKTHQQWREMLR